jgi:hypothetical protein
MRRQCSASCCDPRPVTLEARGAWRVPGTCVWCGMRGFRACMCASCWARRMRMQLATSAWRAWRAVHSLSWALLTPHPTPPHRRVPGAHPDPSDRSGALDHPRVCFACASCLRLCPVTRDSSDGGGCDGLERGRYIMHGGGSARADNNSSTHSVHYTQRWRRACMQPANPNRCALLCTTAPEQACVLRCQRSRLWRRVWRPSRQRGRRWR